MNSSNLNENKKNIEKNTYIDHPINQAQQYLRAKNTQKLKGLIEFNGNFLLKFSKTIKSLNTQEVIYYHKILYESMKKLENIVNNFFIKGV